MVRQQKINGGMEGICHRQEDIEADFCMIVLNITDVGSITAHHLCQFILRQPSVLAHFFYPDTQISVINFLLQEKHLLSCTKYIVYISMYMFLL